ncbi:integral membrane protein Pth11-like, putative [Talaromyces stipitatus ATCC 10500]|uniref:Integral membrane protein Pth11-like, putative n=1 Tax=Talaromyces stipitatus (strain ATCC 10500 / CBS 375.48 / QM 6759 / NRRL 1006) TaxID=441959 RepID=B8M3C0_TALSN|nr:integral membrane protein Pth11-like, putative [Talaromyces stipitatus ATCC 10500]EED22292.1 integral membrane protein Pth11-like, putative [Talaromyces stipitatus ATCC 10500]
MSTLSLVPRDIYKDVPPDPRTALQNNPTLLVCWWCTAASFAIILVRVIGRYKRTERFFTEDKVMMIGAIPLIARMTLVHLVLVWGTNNAKTEGLLEQDIHHREIGSRLVLAARVFYAVYIWLAKYTVCEFLRRLTGMVWTRTFQISLRLIEYFLASTLAVVVIATLVECHPFTHYWQVTPDPGPYCRLGYANLLTMGVCDILTDIFLVVLPVSLFLASAMSVKRKIQLTLLFASSLLLVGITGFRVPAVIQRNGIQNFRSLVASFEILAATAVANFVVIGSFLRDRGLKRAKYKRVERSLSVVGSVDHSSVRRTTITKHHWGSDADLVDGLGIRLDPELHATQRSVMRPAPVVGESIHRHHDHHDDRSLSDSHSIEDYTMTGSSTTSKTLTGIPPPSFADINDPGMSPRTLQRSVSFYDVGATVADTVTVTTTA